MRQSRHIFGASRPQTQSRQQNTTARGAAGEHKAVATDRDSIRARKLCSRVFVGVMPFILGDRGDESAVSQ